MFVYFFAMGAAMFVYIFAMTAAILNYETLKIAQLQKKHICVFSRESWIYGYLLPCTVYPHPTPVLRLYLSRPFSSILRNNVDQIQKRIDSTCGQPADIRRVAVRVFVPGPEN